MVSLLVKLTFALLEFVSTITSKNSILPDDPTITQFLATFYDSSKQYNPRHLSLPRVRERSQAPSEIYYSRIIDSVFIRVKAKRTKAFLCSATIHKTGEFCAQGAHRNY